MSKHAGKSEEISVGERVKRTLLQVGIPAYVLLVAVLPSVLTMIVDSYGEMLPPSVVPVLVGTATALTALAGLVTRIMAIPAVNAWLSLHTPFGTVPKDVAKAAAADNGPEV